MNLDEYPDLLKSEDVAKILNTSTTTVWRLINQRAILPAVKVFGGYKVKKQDLIKAFERELAREVVARSKGEKI